MRPVICWGAGDDAVVVGGETLRFHQRLASAIGARAEVRPARRATVERLCDRFPFFGCFVNRAISEVGNLLRMPQCPTRIRTAGAMASIGRSACVAVLDGVREAAIVDHTGKSAVADSLKLAVPSGR